MYSQRKNGFGGEFLTYFSASAAVMYIGQNTSVFSPPSARSRMIGLVLSISKIALRSAVKLGPSPASLAMDQMRIEGWLRKNFTILVPRSTWLFSH